MRSDRSADLDRAFAALYRALDCDRLGFVRDGMLQMAASALRRAGEY